MMPLLLLAVVVPCTTCPSLILTDAIATVESNGRDDATGDVKTKWPAIGRLQVRQPALTDANQQLTKEGKATYSLAEMRDYAKARAVFWAYMRRYNCDVPEIIARTWNGGPTGPYKKKTLVYWTKVKRAYLKEAKP